MTKLLVILKSKWQFEREYSDGLEKAFRSVVEEFGLYNLYTIDIISCDGPFLTGVSFDFCLDKVGCLKVWVSNNH